MPAAESTDVQRLREPLFTMKFRPELGFRELDENSTNIAWNDAFPLSFLAANIAVALSMLRMVRSRSGNVGKRPLFILGLVELATLWAFLPMALGTFETFYAVQTFRRFSNAASPYTSSALSLLSGASTLLTLIVCHETRRVKEAMLMRRTLQWSLRRQLRFCDPILLLSLTIHLATFIAAYGSVVWRCLDRCMGIIDPYQASSMPSRQETCIPNVNRTVDLHTPLPQTSQASLLVRVGQCLFAVSVIAAPCALLTLASAHLARAHILDGRITEARSLIANGLIEHRPLIIILSATFLAPHILSLAPIFIAPPIVCEPTMLSLLSITNWVLFLSRVVCYSLICKISDQLAMMSAVPCRPMKRSWTQ